MQSFITVYNNIKEKVSFCFKQLQLDKLLINKTGRKLAIKIPEVVALALFKQKYNIATKKSIYEIFDLRYYCSYKTLVVNLNRFWLWALLILKIILQFNKSRAHCLKYTDATDIPVCLNKNAKNHQTMKNQAKWGHSGKGWFYGLKLHLTSDLKRRILALKFTTGNVCDQKVFLDLNTGLEDSLFVADTGYASAKLQRDCYLRNHSILLTKPQKSMRKLMTKFQEFIYTTRMTIEIHFRRLKLFYGLITSLPRSEAGYLANYIYSLLAYQLA